MGNAMPTENRTMLQKADHNLATVAAAGGVLLPEKAQEFWKLALTPTVILKEAVVRPMARYQEILPKAAFLSRVLRPGAESTALSQADRATLSISNVTLDAKEVKAETRIPYDVVEDNIMQDRFINFVMGELTRAIGRDMENMVCNGDTTSSDTLLALFNGARKAVSTNTVNFGSAAVTKTAFLNALKTLPAEYSPANKKELRFYTGYQTELAYRDTLATRATVGGDRFVQEDAPITVYGVPLVPVPMFPENLGGGTNECEIILTQPENLVVGVWQTITLKTAEDISAGEIHVVARMRFGFRYTHEPAAVRVYGVTH